MKKTLLSFLCIGSACMVMAQTTPSQQTRPSTEPNRNTTTTPPSVNNQQTTTPASVTQQPTNTPATLNQQPANSTLNNTSTQQLPTPVNSPNGAVNGHNTIMDANRNAPANNNMNNTQPNSTLNGNTMPVNSNSGNMNNSNMNNMNNANMNGTLNGTTNGTLGSTTANAAYSVTVPTSVQTSFTTAYPAAGNSSWSQSGDWYRARYMENGKLMEASYREDGKAFTRPASPIMRSYVPEEAVSKALEMYGMNVYAIAASKSADGQMRYNVTIIENGQSRTEWMNEDGSAVTNPYRTEMDDQSTNQQMNNNNGQQVIEPAAIDQAAPATINSAPVADPQNNTNMNNNETQQQSTLKQGEGSQQVTPDNRMNNSGINNATGSDTLKRKRNDVPKEQ